MPFNFCLFFFCTKTIPISFLDHRRIARFALEQREREAARLASKKEALDRGAKLLQELTARMMAEQDAREEMENAILDLAEEEKVTECRSDSMIKQSRTT